MIGHAGNMKNQISNTEVFKGIILRTQDRGGFSLIEVVIVAALAVGVLFVIVSLRGNVGNLENIITQKLESRQDIEQVFQIMTTEIRSASPASNGAYAIEAATTSSLIFYSDVDGDKIYDKVRYFLATSTVVTSTVYRGVIKPTGNPLQYATSSEVISTAVKNYVKSTSTSLFEYYDASYTGSEPAMSSTTDVTKSRLIKVSVYADVTPGKAPKPVFFSSFVSIRNLRSN
mgnify:FL=1